MSDERIAASIEDATPAPPGFLHRLWNNVLAEPLRRIDGEARLYLNSEAARGVDWKVVAVMATAAVSLTVQYYYVIAGGIDEVIGLLRALGLSGWADSLHEAMIDPAQGEINRLTFWVAGNFVVYFVLPALVIRLVFRERIRDYGVKLKGVFSDFWIYAVMFAIMVPLLLLVSRNAHFKRTYPFYHLALREPLWPNFWRWELEYAFQFFCLEFFFRGFIVHGTKHRFGCYAIFVMMIPYCMIHYGKPMPEAFAAIVAGIALGFMSLKTRSIWMGAAIHVTVALSMDFVSMWRQGVFGH